MRSQLTWWQRGIIYQIYPRSFQDSNNDGVGDLPGILSRLDYLQSLNVDAVWVSPIYPSPMLDFGYDVSDYTAIHPLFGSMQDFDRLLAEMHRRGLKLILDLVPNHTSWEHLWFLESRSSRENPRRDWYIWHDPAPDGGPPNNWQSHFGGPAWSFDKRTGQYYLHLFHESQPDLNYRNPQVMPAIQRVMRFWLDKGVDGFRVDVIWMMLKDEQLRDNPPSPRGDRLLPRYTRNLPGVHDLIRQLRSVVDEYEQRVMIGEIYEPVDVLAQYYGQDDECHLPFNFHLIMQPWRARAVRKHVEKYEAALPPSAWPNYVLGNHDQHRIATRLGSEQARVGTLMLMTLRGTPTWYYGDEIGMHDVPIPPELVRDPPAVLQPEKADKVGRDPERTPMQWDASPNAGFCPPASKPWLPVASDYGQNNVASEENDNTSMLAFFRALTALRRKEPALHGGAYQTLESNEPQVYSFLRSHPGTDSFLVVLNFSGTRYDLDLSHAHNITGTSQADQELGTDMQFSGPISLEKLSLGAHQGLLIRLR